MRFIAFVFIGLAFYGCKKSGGDSPLMAASSAVSAPPILPGDSITFLALGDSYTYGLDVQQNQSFPFQLDSVLHQNGYKPATPTIIARFGWTSADLLAGMATANITQHFDLVILLIGVNDQNKGVNAETFRSNLDRLISSAVLLARGYSSRVFVISIPDWSVTPFASDLNKVEIAAQLQLFNTINQAEAGKFKVNYIDVTTLSELAANDPTLTSYDGLHPSATMYTRWVNLFYTKIAASFQE